MPVRTLVLVAVALVAGCVVVGGVGVGGSTAAAQQVWVEPVDAPVVDGFRPPAHIGAPGNRGWEYATEPGTTVVAAGAGVVAFAGPVAGTLVVTVAHPDGTRTTYTHLASVDIAVGTPVTAGEPVGVSGDRLHFGVRDGAEYLDPAGLFAGDGAGAADGGGGVEVPVGLRLVPVAGEVGSPAGAIVARTATSAPVGPRLVVPWALLR